MMVTTTITLALVYAIIFYSSAAVEIFPNSNNPFITTTLTNDPRGINEVNSNNTWKLFQDFRTNPLLNDWGLVLTLDSAEYSFRDRDGSSISISMDGFCSSRQCDGYFGFSIGDEEYFTFVTDFDGSFNVNSGSGLPVLNGIFIYPGCGSSSIESGNPSELFPSPDLNMGLIRDAFSGGDHTQFHSLSEMGNGENFPITFELINNAQSDSFIFKFSSPTFTTPLECRYNSSVGIHKDFKLYITPDIVGSETLLITKFDVNGEDCMSSQSTDAADATESG